MNISQFGSWFSAAPNRTLKSMWRGLLLSLLVSANQGISGTVQPLPSLPDGATANAVQVDQTGNIYVAGYATGPIFDRLHGEGKKEGGGNTDGFLLGFSNCSYSIQPASYEFPQGGGSTSIAITASSSDCQWSASSPLDWVTVSPATGAGSGSVTVTVTPNTTGTRQLGNITIAGISFLVGQDQ